MKKRALIGAVWGLGLLSTTAMGQTIGPIMLDLGTSTYALATNATPAGNATNGWTKLLTGNASVVNGTGYEWDNVAGTPYTLYMTNINSTGSAGGGLDNDGFKSANGGSPATNATFILSGLPVGSYTVTLYGCAGPNGWSQGARVHYGGATNILWYNGQMPNPSVLTMQNLGRTNVSAAGTVSGIFYGQNNNFNGSGYIGALIFDVEPYGPALTMKGINPLLVPAGGTYTEPGVTAVDTSNNSAITVTTSGTVNTITPGTNILTYTAVADGITNTLTRTVVVVNYDFVNLCLGQANLACLIPYGFTKVSSSSTSSGTLINVTNTIASAAGQSYKIIFTNIYAGNSVNNVATNFCPIDAEAFDSRSGPNTNCGFALIGLTPGSSVTLYANWGYNGSSTPAVITYGGVTLTNNGSSGFPNPSTSTMQQIGTASADATGTVQGFWTGKPTSTIGEISGMIFTIVTPVGHSMTISPTGITNTCGTNATFIASAVAGATGYQWYDNLSHLITGATNLTINLTGLKPSNNGNYSIIATGSGWTSTNSVVIDMIDVAPPVMTMAGNRVVVATLNSTWADPGVTAYDTCAGNYLTVTTSGTVNTSVAGEYDLTYSATTLNGNPGSLTRAVIVIDPTVAVPGISMDLDYAPATDEFGVATPDGWAVLLFGDITVVPAVEGNVSFPNPDGNNPDLTLSFTDISGWSSASASLDATAGISTNGFFNYGCKAATANPPGDGQPATFTLSGVPVGQCVSIYAVNGWNAMKSPPKIIYGGQTNIVTANSLDATPTLAEFQYVGTAIATNGVVTGSWSGTNGPANGQPEGQIGGMIFEIQSIPVNSLAISPSSVTPQCGSNVTFTATVYGIKPITLQWYDNHTNLIVGATNATYTLVDPTPVKAGNYTVVAKNAFGIATNIATVTAVVDVALPVMALNGINPVNLLVNSTYVDAGATAYDLCAQGSLSVQTDNPVDTTTIGTYTVTYTATTANNNTGTITRTVNVTAIPNLALNLDFAPNDVNVPAAPAGFTLIQSGAYPAIGNYNYPNVAGSIYSLSVSNIGQYTYGDINFPLTTDGFYKPSANNNPATFTLSGVQPTLKVTLYAIYGWNGAGQAGNVFFGGTNTQIANTVDPGNNVPSLTNFTRIGATLVGSSGVVSGYWQGPITGSGTNKEGQVGGMVFLVGTNTPPVASNILMSAPSGQPVIMNIIGGSNAPTDADGDPLTVTAVQSPTPHNSTVTTTGINVTYTSSNGFVGQDTFTYTVGDGFGGFATATVTVSVAAFNVLSAPTLNGGVYQVGYQGIPYASYILLNTPSLTPPVTWTPVVTNTADASGVITFTFTPSQGAGFYRTISLH